jgi:hypothetical protein
MDSSCILDFHCLGKTEERRVHSGAGNLGALHWRSNWTEQQENRVKEKTHRRAARTDRRAVVDRHAPATRLEAGVQTHERTNWRWDWAPGTRVGTEPSRDLRTPTWAESAEHKKKTRQGPNNCKEKQLLALRLRSRQWSPAESRTRAIEKQQADAT